jgi:hypothetical protein
MNMLCVTSVIVLLAASATAGAATAEHSQPAIWAAHSVIVDLRNLPQRYTCDELWYKFKGVLTTLGARPDMKIIPYRCERALGAGGYSPKVQLDFAVPRLVNDKNARWADMQVSRKSIRLEAGTPGRIDAHDCELLNQIRSTLLHYLGATVTEFNLACQAPQSLQSPFGITVTALIPVSQSEPTVASSALPDRSGPLSDRSGS